MVNYGSMFEAPLCEDYKGLRALILRPVCRYAVPMLDSTATEMARRGAVELVSLLAKRLQGVLCVECTPNIDASNLHPETGN